MSKKNKTIVLISCIILVISISYIISGIGGKEELKGNINILVKEDTYEYINQEAKKFEIANKKVKINIFLNKDISDIDDFIKVNNIDIVQCNSMEYLSIDNNRVNSSLSTEIINTYKKNFSQSRLVESTNNGKYFAVPFTSNPLALYIREDILKQYGYSVGDISTWDDLLTVGIDIFNKTKGEMRIFNKKDWLNICTLLSIQYIEEYGDGVEANKLTDNKLSFLLDKQLIGFYGEDNYLCRISSIDFIEEEKENQWKCVNSPSIKPGGNRFYDVGGDGLIIIINEEDNINLVSTFIGYITSNIEALTDEMLEGRFFPSSVLAYKNKIVESKVSNIEGESPFVILTNISEKALPINSFDEYLNKLKEILSKWVI